MLGILATSLILWDEIEPTSLWFYDEIPEFLSIVFRNLRRKSLRMWICKRLIKRIVILLVERLWLLDAGMVNSNAFKTLYNYARIFRALRKSLSVSSLENLQSRSVLMLFY